ncbi:hypothetical protein L1787_18865 [Acuticoccus sp. M5D2P5]|uniref:hypothetical protein n=1 Tax=Acuticoccus kalidii TaxID=2910977 RepID=UPI001F474DB4|nr:hypothetical protein [Acuticoccus kalidii]MCF3935457.1 hypothetical protein [Acuticoccus kalidii]
MSTVTAREFTLTGSDKERGFFSRLGSGIIASRKRQADRAVAAYLMSLDDETLARLGYDRAEIEAQQPAGYPFY